jgi:hypothetical protein
MFFGMLLKTKVRISMAAETRTFLSGGNLNLYHGNIHQ